jgi:protein O-mannosyl-transferase
MPMTPVVPSVKSQIGSILTLILLLLLVYFNSLQGSFHFDDRNLIDREWIADLDAFNKNVHIAEFENRPVLLWTFALNNSLHKNKVFGFHLFNLLLHAFVSVLVFVILVLTQKFHHPPSAGNRPCNLSLQLPLFAALLFAVHPLNTDSVSYISSRSAVLATFFYLLSLYTFLRIFSPCKNQRQKPVQICWGLLTALGMYLAIASKLIAVTLPVGLGLWFLIFICPVRYPGLSIRLFSRKMIAAYAVGFSVLLAAALFVGPGVLYAPKDQGLMLFGRVPYLLVEAKVIIFHYLKLFFAPINLNVDIGFPFTTYHHDPQIALAILLIGALLYRAFKSKNTWFRAGVLWFFLTLMPTSSFVPLNDLAVEHRTYLPMTLGLCLIIGGAISQIPAGWGSRFMVVTIALLSLLTLSRNGVWTDEVRLWQDAVKKNPLSSRTHNNLGKAYYEKGQLDEALFHFQKSNENIENHLTRQYNLANLKDASQQQRVANLAEPHYNLASVYLDKGNLKQAEREYQTAIRLNPDYFSAYLGLGSVYARMNQLNQAVDAFRTAIQKKKLATGEKDYPLARLNLGEIYGRAGKFEDAIRELVLAVQHDPSLVLGHYNLGLAYLMTGKLTEAEQALTACLGLNNRFEPALFTLARVTQAKGEWQRSTRQFEKFLSVKGEDAGAYYQIGWNYRQTGQRDLARKHLSRALASNPPPKLAEEISRLLRELS